MTEVMYNEYANEVLGAISKGAFLNVRAEGNDNTMTNRIGCYFLYMV